MTEEPIPHSQIAGEAVQRAILDYLHERPRAADSLCGIAEWWMLHYTAEAVWSALEQLCQSGLVERITAGGEPVYRLKTDHSGPEGNTHDGS